MKVILILVSYLKNKKLINTSCIVLVIFSSLTYASSVRVKELVRVEGIRDNAIIGYGIVVGLAGTGDSSRSKASVQSVLNALSNFGVTVSQEDISSRNVAAVIVTSVLQPFAQVGDKINVSVSSIGDARSLTGGTLLLTPLQAANNQVYVLAQGSVSVGGFKYDVNGNVVQKNHPTVGIVPEGGVVEKQMSTQFTNGEADQQLAFLLNAPDFTTANRLKEAINKKFGEDLANVEHPGKVVVSLNGRDPISFISETENLLITPDTKARVVINERTGTVVSGGNIVIDGITISHGNIRVVVATQFAASQPSIIGNGGNNVSTIVVSNSQLDVDEDEPSSLALPSGTNIEDLVAALRQVKASTRDVISIIQAINEAGALHAEIVIQ